MRGGNGRGGGTGSPAARAADRFGAFGLPGGDLCEANDAIDFPIGSFSYDDRELALAETEDLWSAGRCGRGTPTAPPRA